VSAPRQPGLPFGATPPARRLPDADARERAVTDFGTNLVVTAGAGTGKTSLLVERTLVAIATGVAAIDRLAAITFTERAAGELKTRISSGLDRLRRMARREEPADDRFEAGRVMARLAGGATDTGAIEARCLAAMERLDRATITTIHGFCAELLRSFPLEAGVDPDFDVDAGEAEATLRDAAWDELVGRELGPEAGRAAEWSRLLGTAPLGEIDALAAHLASFGVPADLLEADRTPEAARLLADEARRCATRVEEALAIPDALTDGMRARLYALRSVVVAYAEGGLDAFRASLGTTDVEADVNVRTKSGHEARTIKAAHQEARRLIRALSRIDDGAVRLAIDLLRPFSASFRERYLAAGQVSFDGLLALARDLLRDRPETRRHARERFRLLLVDEFQDTDPLQCEIVLFLAEAEGVPAPDAWSAALAPGRLFVVGDPKQSIYRFRGADHTAYRAAVDRIVAEGGVGLDLVTSFRSVPAVLRPVNALFEEAGGCWEPGAYQPEYVAVRPAREDRDIAPRVELWTAFDPSGRPLRAPARRRVEADAIAEEIDRGVREGRVDYRRVTLLLRTFSHLSDWLRALRERDIPFVVDGGRDFLKRPEVAQLLATLRALACPSDPVALLAYLRSPAGGASDVELLRWAREGTGWRFTAEPDELAFPAIARAFRTLRALRAGTRDLPADLLVHRVLAATDMAAYGAASFEGPQRVANLDKIAAAVADLARDGRLSLEEVLDALETERLEEIKTDRPLADDAVEAVRVTTIHRMKGLENDWIFVPDLARTDRPPPDVEPRVAIATFPGGGAGLAVRLREIRDTTWAWWELESQRHERAEELRVLYVAATRARERLVLVAGPVSGTTQWIDALAPWGYRDPAAPPDDGVPLAEGRVLHRRIEPAPRRRRAPRERAVEGVAEAVDAWRRAVARAHEIARPPLAAPSTAAEALPPRRRDAAPEAVARAVGVAIHRRLEGWTGEAASASRPPSPADEIEALATLAAEEADVPAERVLAEAREVLSAFRASPLAARLASVDAVGRELPMLYRSPDGAAWRGTIDLLYRDVEGRLVVADFKTDRESDESVLRERYGKQLAVYADAVREALELTERPRTELWLLRSGRVVGLGSGEV
jgi:ATP-dependent helicase/nuclease subunit A